MILSWLLIGPIILHFRFLVKKPTLMFLFKPTFGPIFTLWPVYSVAIWVSAFTRLYRRYRFWLIWQEVWHFTNEKKLKGFPDFITMCWLFLMKMDVGPIFLYQSCQLCPYGSFMTNISPKNIFKIDF